VRRTVEICWPGARCLLPELPLSIFSVDDPNRVVVELLEIIDDEVDHAAKTGDPITNIVLIGHSLGALLARKLYVAACGEISSAPLEDVFAESGDRTTDGRLAAREWAPRVSRLILLAGTNRGWQINHHMGRARASLWRLGLVVSRVTRLLRRREPLITSVRRGAAFVTQLRIQWIRMRQRYTRDAGIVVGGALAIQLLGSLDDMVAPDDNIDLVSGGDFVYLDVPWSGHSSVVDMDDSSAGRVRREVFVRALTEPTNLLRDAAIVPADEKFSAPDERVQRLVFVIHGIRDVGHWTHKIARRVKTRAQRPVHEWATETSSYGYFPMLHFVLPRYRREKVEWLMDQYTEALARYPNATFSFVGHSNGTYLLGKALELYPCCSFDHVVFAGSVVQSSYDWKQYLNNDPPRVKAVLNFVATTDWVVAIFPKFFELLRLQDLGSAVHDGFIATSNNSNLHEVSYVQGKHSAAIAESMRDTIADFVIDGKMPAGEIGRLKKERSTWLVLLGRVPWFGWLAIAVVIIAVWLGIAWASCEMAPSAFTRAFALGVATVAYPLMLWLGFARL